MTERAKGLSEQQYRFAEEYAIDLNTKRAAVAAGLSAKVSNHWLRHSHASHALDHGAPIQLVRDTLGHSSVATTNQYAHARPGASSASYLGKRKDKFLNEFLLALKIVNDGKIPAAEMKSSWAGAMGLTQFLPSDYFKYAVDFDGDGKADPIYLDGATGVWHVKLSASGYAEATLASGYTP